MTNASALSEKKLPLGCRLREFLRDKSRSLLHQNNNKYFCIFQFFEMDCRTPVPSESKLNGFIEEGQPCQIPPPAGAEDYHDHEVL